MSVVSEKTQDRGPRRLWKTPGSPSSRLWLAVSFLLYAGLLGWYIYAFRTQQYPAPANNPFLLFGIFAYLLVLVAASYSVRRRFLRSLPGMVQNWLWMHTWLGVITILVACLHENFGFITHDYCQNLGCLTATYWAAGALYALLLLVFVGIVGRLLDLWQGRVIAYEAAHNGVGIAQALRTRLRDYEYTVERYCAGRSDAFKWACHTALTSDEASVAPPADLAEHEYGAWDKVSQIVRDYGRLKRSLQRQQRARRVIQTWRTVHIVVAILALSIISYHGLMELLTTVWHVIPVAN